MQGVRIIRVAVDLSAAKAGGGWTYLTELVPRLTEQADTTIALALAPPGEGRRVSDCGIRAVSEAESRVGFLSPRWLREVRRHADVVFAPTEIGVSPPGVPLVLSIRNPNLDPRNTADRSGRARVRHGIQRSVARASVKNAARVIAVSQYASSIASRFLRVDPDLIRVVYHGSPVRQLQGGRAPRVCTRFLFVSNLNEYKGADFLIKALANVEGPWKLRIVGKEVRRPYARKVKDLASEFGLAPRVEFAGPLYGKELEEAYESSDCLLWPSPVETFGHPLVEASAHGMPIIAVDSASNREVAGGAAHYYAKGDVGQLAALVRQAQCRGLTAARLPRTYDWDLCAKETSQVLREAAAVTG